jgi:hypothetical protein
MPMSHCPHCQALLQVPDDVAAHALRCESCNRVLPPIIQFAPIEPAIAVTKLVDGHERRGPAPGIQHASLVAVGIVGGLVVVALLAATWLVLRSNLVVIGPEQPPLAQPSKKPADVLPNPPVVVDPPQKPSIGSPAFPACPNPRPPVPSP